MRNISCFIGLIFFTISINAQEFIYQETIDLDSDGDSEIIKIELIQGTYYQFILKIADQEIRDTLGEGINGFQIIDIDKTDKYKEIAVHSSGPSNDDEYKIYWYDGDTIKKMAFIERWPTFLGNGIVYVDNWEGFWTKRDKYLLNKNDRTLDHIPQFAYYIGIKIRVENSFTIYREKDLKDEVALLSKYSEIELLLCDTEKKEGDKYLYLIKSESGLVGWTRSDVLIKNTTGINWAD